MNIIDTTSNVQTYGGDSIYKWRTKTVKQADILITIISDKQNLQRDSMVNESEDIQVVEIASVCLSQVNLINRIIKDNEQISDLLVICENQIDELDFLGKMLEILHSCERHGAVVPLNMHSQGISRLTRAEYRRVAEYLSEYKVIPYIESLPVLIKAEMFERFGLLDESFHNIRDALLDFSLRFNQYGWSTARVNCWSDDEISTEENMKSGRDIIQRRYPYIQEIEEIYYKRAESAVEHFAKELAQYKECKPSLLFSLYEVPASFNGTANYALKLLAAFWDSYHMKYEISILVKRNTDEFYKLSDKYPNVYYPETAKHNTFCLGYVVSQILDAEHMDLINKCCLKYCVCMLDIISLRSHYLCRNDKNRFELFRDSIEYADLMLSISRFSKNDIVSFFHDEVQNADVCTGYIYLASDKVLSDAGTEGKTIPFKTGDYFIVIGNAYRHKMIEPVLNVLKDIKENFIVIGLKTEGYYHKSKRIYGYVSGWLDQGILNQMIAGSKCIIFPSVYEGFGLTLYDAVVYRKKIIVSDTQVNLELKELLREYRERIITYRRLEELKTILTDNDFEDNCSEKPARIRSWQEMAGELDIWIESMQRKELDTVRLERRWKYLKRYQGEDKYVVKGKISVRRDRLIRKCISSFPRTYQLYRRLITAIDKEHYGSR